MKTILKGVFTLFFCATKGNGMKSFLIGIVMSACTAAVLAISPVAFADECLLCDAAQNGDAAEVKRLLAEEADVNATDTVGETALSKAAQQGNSEIVLMLLTAGANPNMRVEIGILPLLAATWREDTEMVRILLAGGADTRGTDEEGITALMWAARNGYAEIVKVLLSAGADVNYANQKWYTALYNAQEKGHSEIVRILKEAGATKTPEDVDAAVLASLEVDPDAHFCWRYGLPHFRVSAGYTDQQHSWCARCSHADGFIGDPEYAETIEWCLHNAYK